MKPHELARALAGIVAPPRCAICACACVWRELACGRCERALRDAAPVRRVLPGLDRVIGAGTYEGVHRQLVAALKFGPRPALASLAAAPMARALVASATGTAAIVPVPPAPGRLRIRGFDPAEMIAASLAGQLGLPLERPLRRRGGRRQVGRARAARIAAPPRVRCAGRAPGAVLLVDDVFTTGATLAACARALRSAGTGRVAAVTFAVALPGRRRSLGRRPATA